MSEWCVVSVNVGRPRLFVHRGRQYTTAINKQPVDGPVDLTETGFVGDKQADERNHGGAEMAACCYPHEHYAFFAQRLGVDLSVPSFGENLTTSGMLESECCIGDVYEVGSAVVQITKPREPCVKLARKHDQPQLPQWIRDSSYCGFYVRVVRPGPVAAGDSIRLLDRSHKGLSIANAMRAMFGDPPPLDLVAALAELPVMARGWRVRLQRRLAMENPPGRAARH